MPTVFMEPAFMATREACVELYATEGFGLWIAPEVLAEVVCPICFSVDFGPGGHLGWHDAHEVSLLLMHWDEIQPPSITVFLGDEDDEEEDDEY